MPDSVLITGASSGIGRALAIEFSRRGYALGLCARRLELLENLQHELSRNHAVEIAELDVSQYEAVKEVLFKLAEKLGGAKIIIANAGVGERSLPGEGTFYLDRRVIEINLLGAMATIDAGAEILKKQGGGQIVGISSVAGFRGLSKVPAYSASKSALSTYMEGIRHHLIDTKDPNEQYSVAEFCTRVSEIIQETPSNYIICGGTGLYCRAFLYNYDFHLYFRKF